MNHWQKREVARDAENNGVAVVVPGYEGWTFRIGRMCSWNLQYQAAIAALSVQPRFAGLLERCAVPGYVQTEQDRIDDADMGRLAIARGILLGWVGVTDADGAPFEFSPQSAHSLLVYFPDIAEYLGNKARDPATFAGVAPIDTPAKKARVTRGNS